MTEIPTEEQALGDKPSVQGAPEVTPDPETQAFGAPERPRLGGLGFRFPTAWPKKRSPRMRMSPITATRIRSPEWAFSSCFSLPSTLVLESCWSGSEACGSGCAVRRCRAFCCSAARR